MAGTIRAWNSACAETHRGAAAGLEVEHGPQLGQHVQAVQAQRVLLPARAEGGSELAVAGPVDLLDPGPHLVQRFLARSSPASFHHRGTGAGYTAGHAIAVAVREDPGQPGGQPVDPLAGALQPGEDRGLVPERPAEPGDERPRARSSRR